MHTFSASLLLLALAYIEIFLFSFQVSLTLKVLLSKQQGELRVTDANFGKGAEERGHLHCSGNVI